MWAKVPGDTSLLLFGLGQCQNPGRQASMGAGLPKEVPASLVNMLCGSGLRSVCLGARAILGGDAEIVVAGGQESMSKVSRSTCTICQSFRVPCGARSLSHRWRYLFSKTHLNEAVSARWLNNQRVDFSEYRNLAIGLITAAVCLGSSRCAHEEWSEDG